MTSRMTVLPPDLPILRVVIRLCDAVDAVRDRQPVSPQGYCPADDSFVPEPDEMTNLREHLRGLSDGYQAQIHAVYWLGRKLDGDLDQYSQLYRYALATDLGACGAAYLAAKANLGEGLRRGLERLGLSLDQKTPRSSSNLHPATYVED